MAAQGRPVPREAERRFCPAVFPALPVRAQRGIIKGAVAQLARAPALQAGCQGFESLQLHHFFLNILE